LLDVAISIRKLTKKTRLFGPRLEEIRSLAVTLIPGSICPKATAALVVTISLIIIKALKNH
jgi:hypothetical protein